MAKPGLHGQWDVGWGHRGPIGLGRPPPACLRVPATASPPHKPSLLKASMPQDKPPSVLQRPDEGLGRAVPLFSAVVDNQNKLHPDSQGEGQPP